MSLYKEFEVQTFDERVIEVKCIVDIVYVPLLLSVSLYLPLYYTRASRMFENNLTRSR